MKVLESQSATLSNPEVLAHLEAMRRKPRTTSSKSQNLETVLKELTEYLSPPTSRFSPLPPYKPPHYTPAAIRALLAKLETYKLTKAELLMMVNLRPEELGLLDCVVEECDLRLTEEEQLAILGVVGEVFGRGVENGNGDEVEDAEEGTNEI